MNFHNLIYWRHQLIAAIIFVIFTFERLFVPDTSKLQHLIRTIYTVDGYEKMIALVHHIYVKVRVLGKLVKFSCKFFLFGLIFFSFFRLI